MKKYLALACVVASFAVVMLSTSAVAHARSSRHRTINVTICHHGQTLSVPLTALLHHLLHGDTFGRCPTPTPSTLLFVSLNGTHEVSAVSTSGVAQTFATGFNFPSGMTRDAANNLYVANYSAGSVDMISGSGTVTTFASMSIPYGLAFDTAGNLYVSHLGTTANPNYDTVSKVLPNGTVSTFATGFNAPSGLAFDIAGNLYVANRDAGTVSQVSSSGTVTTFASGLNSPNGLAMGTDGYLYVADWGTDSVKRIASDGTVTTFASTGDNPLGLAFDSAGNLYVANYDGNTITKITPSGVSSVFASGLSAPAFLVVGPGH